MMKYSLEKRSLENLFTSIRSEMQAIMDVRGMNATGRTRESITYEIRETRGFLRGPEHIEYVERGRGPGKFPPLEPIKDWCIAKGIPVEAAYPIATIIAREGTKLFKNKEKSGILSKTLTKARLDTFIKEYLENKGTEIRGRYAEMFKD